MRYSHSTTKCTTYTPQGVGADLSRPYPYITKYAFSHYQIHIFISPHAFTHCQIRIFISPHTHIRSSFCGCFHICGHDKSAPTAACGLLITLLANWNNVANILWKIYVRSQNGLRTYSYIVFFLLLYCLFGANWALLCEWLNVYFALFRGSTSLYSTFMWNSGVMLMHCCSKSSSM